MDFFSNFMLKDPMESFMKGLPCFICKKPIDGNHKILIKTKIAPDDSYYTLEEYICNSCFEKATSRTKQVVR